MKQVFNVVAVLDSIDEIPVIQLFGWITEVR